MNKLFHKTGSNFNWLIFNTLHELFDNQAYIMQPCSSLGLKISYMNKKTHFFGQEPTVH